MQELPPTPDLTEILIVLFLVGVVSSGITEIVKLWLKKKTKAKKSNPFLWRGLFRLIPICLGALMGSYFFIMPWGTATGAAGGVLSVVVYKKAKSLITNLKDV